MLDVVGQRASSCSSIYPEGNTKCADAVAAYEACLTDHRTFAGWPLESVMAALRRHSGADWIDAFFGRYLDSGRIDRLLLETAEDR